MHDSKAANIVLIVLLAFIGSFLVAKASKPPCLRHYSCSLAGHYALGRLRRYALNCVLVLLSSLVDRLLLEGEAAEEAGSHAGENINSARSYGGRQDG